MKNTYWQTPSCDLQGVQIKEPPPPPPPYTFDGFDTIQHLAGCAWGGIDALVSTMELNAITFWKNMVKHESRRRRHIKTNLDKKWIMLLSTHLQNEPCIHLVCQLQDNLYDKWWSEEATSKNTQFPGPVPHALLFASPTYSFKSTTCACSQFQVSSQACN